MLNVWCVLWGDKYPHYYAQRLKREVEKHLPISHRFRCLSDQTIEGVETHPQVSDKPGWFQKIDLLDFQGPALYFDLDTVITGPLDVFIGTRADLRTLKNWAASGHGGIQSSIMYWEDARIVGQLFDHEWITWPPVNNPGVPWGDQGVLSILRDDGRLAVDYFDPAHALSYKYHCRQGIPPDCRAVIFHGKPDPHEVQEPWFQW